MSVLCLFDFILNSISNMQGEYNSVDYSAFISIILTALSVILTAMTVVIGVVAWYTISKINKKAKSVASKAVDAKLKELEHEKIIPFIKDTILVKINEQINIMIKNGEFEEYIRHNRKSALNPDTEKEFQEKEE